MIFQVLGWIGTILFIYGIWILGDQNIFGFYINATANLCYAWQSVYLNNHPLFWLSIILIILNLRGIYLWSIKNKQSKINWQDEQLYSHAVADLYK